MVSSTGPCNVDDNIRRNALGRYKLLTVDERGAEVYFRRNNGSFSYLYKDNVGCWTVSEDVKIKFK